MAIDNAKKLLKRYNERKYAQFILNDADELSLPASSSVPWIVTAQRKVLFKKIRSNASPSHVCFIKKNERPHGFLWKTTAAQLQQGVRWGIIKPESITGKVIFTLGQYRINAHERVAKGMIGNTHALKLKLVDFYQERCALLQQMESLVNKSNTVEDYQDVITRYLNELKTISENLDEYFDEVQLQKVHPKAVADMRSSLASDMQRAERYLASLTNQKSLRANNRARGHKSILEFVKQQMIHHLYEFQGINQAITYSNKRQFALTRGVINDYIEDARKEIDDHLADPRNAVTPEHHGVFSSNPENLVTYDFASQHLSPYHERQTLLAISFIEGWDSVNNSATNAPTVSNSSGVQPLSIISATKWRSHRNFITSLKSFSYYFWNIIKSAVVATKPWEEESWRNKKQDQRFHLVAAGLRQQVRSDEPMWLKPVKFFRQLLSITKDILVGVHNFGANLVIKLPEDLVNDWNSTKDKPTVEEVFQQASLEIQAIQANEQLVLNRVFQKSNYVEQVTQEPSSTLAKVSYHLTPGEQNDLLSAAVRGLDSFSSVFTHSIYAKDPIAGLLFTATYGLGAATIYLPTLVKAIFGQRYVDWFTNFSYTMASNPLGATISGGSTQAQAFASSWDLVMHGPESGVADAVSQVVENPLTAAAYSAVAYGLGYALVNGVLGYKIPIVSDLLKEDLGTIPSTGYPIIGAKVALTLIEAFHRPPPIPAYNITGLSYNGTELDGVPWKAFASHQKRTIERFCLAYWLGKHASTLPKLKSDTLFTIAQYIDTLFTSEEAHSLKKILYPEKIYSIPFQLFYIPLMYIPAVLRVGGSLILSTIAWFKENPHPWEPVKQASNALAAKCIKDLNRLFIAASGFIHMLFNISTSFFKALTFTVNMIVGRIAGVLGLFNAGHLFHRGVAALHVFSRTIGEFLYPARSTKSVVFAHPAHTVKETESSYHKLMAEFHVKKRGDETSKDDSGSDLLINSANNSEAVPVPVPVPVSSNNTGINLDPTRTLSTSSFS